MTRARSTLLIVALAACSDAAPPAAAPVTHLALAGGNEQIVLPGRPAPLPLAVRVADASGAPQAGVTVAWTITSGGGSIPGSSVSDADGLATATFQAGATLGATFVSAALPGAVGSPVTFFLSVVSGIVQVASVPIPANYGIHDQFFRDGLLFVSAWNSGLRIYDVGNGRSGGTPTAPVLVSSIITSDNGVPGGAQVHNAWWFWAPNGAKRYVFVGQEGFGQIGVSSRGDIHVVDVTDLANPVEVAFYHMPDVEGQPAGTHNFWMDEAAQILYAAYYNGGVVALDVSGTLSGDLAAREIARIRPGGSGGFVWGVQLHNGSLYASDMVRGLWQLSLTGGAFTVAGGGNNVPDRFTSDLWVRGSTAYTGTWGSRSGGRGNAVKIWSLDAAGAPAPADTIIVANIGTVSDVEVSDDGRVLLFSAEGGSGSGIHLYSLVANPRAPQFLAFHPVASGVHTTTFGTVGGRRYVFAAKDPASPALLILDVTELWP